MYALYVCLIYRRRIADGASATGAVPREHARVLGGPAGSAWAAVASAALPGTRMQARGAHGPARFLPGWPYMHALYVCLICLPYMYALYACLTCMMPYMHALYVCLVCLPYMYALYVCLTCMMPYMHVLNVSLQNGGPPCLHFACLK